VKTVRQKHKARARTEEARSKRRKDECPECRGTKISYRDSKGNSDHMNAHLCTKCL
jgi:hypothetical protein